MTGEPSSNARRSAPGEQALTATPSDAGDRAPGATPASAEEALDLFLAARMRGEDPDPTRFVEEHPEFAPDLGRALEALLALERVSETDTPRADLPERIGPFRVVREIGRGGMGIVLEAVEDALHRRVALKMLPPELLPSSSARARFKREAELAARLEHPGIATVYATGVADDRPWIAMRFVEGRALADSIAAARAEEARCARPGPQTAGGRSRPLVVAACLAQVARALHFAHERGVVHRDVKPSNIVVRPDGLPVLLDFGLAISGSSDEESVTRTGDLPGTPNYLPPENIAGEISRPDAQGDVYALGITLFECLALARPFEGPTTSALYRAILTAPPPNVRSLNREVSRDLAVVVAAAIERDRSRRYQDAAAFAADLEACVAGRPIAARPVPWHGRLARWAKREPRQATLAVGLLAATVAAISVGLVWWASRGEVRVAEHVARTRELEDALGEGFALLTTGASARADDAFQRALEIDPSSIEALSGRVLTAIERVPEAEQRERLARVPATTRGRDALEALVDGRPPPIEAAGRDLEGASAFEFCLRGLCAEGQALRLPISERAPLYAAALRCFTEAILRAPAARALYYEQRALAAQQAGDEPTARSAATALTALWPDSPRALYAAGRALHTFDPAESRRLLERSVELGPRDLDARTMLAIACVLQGDLEAAERAAWLGLAIDPGHAMLHFWLGESLMRRGCDVESRDAYVRAAELSPDHPGIVAGAALAEMMTGDAERARDHYRRAVALDPLQQRIRFFYSVALERAGDTLGAQSESDAAIAGLFPFEVGFWKASAGASLQLGARRVARAAADAGLALAPADAELLSIREEAGEPFDTVH